MGFVMHAIHNYTCVSNSYLVIGGKSKQVFGIWYAWSADLIKHCIVKLHKFGENQLEG